MSNAEWLGLAETRLATVKRYNPDSAEVARLTFAVNDLRSKV